MTPAEQHLARPREALSRGRAAVLGFVAAHDRRHVEQIRAALRSKLR
jgi:hypothetical protein